MSSISPVKVPTEPKKTGLRKVLGKQVAAAEAKANLLRMLSSVEQVGEYVITKRGKPVAKLVPFEPQPKASIYGCMKGTAVIHGDIMEPLPPEEWGDLY